MSDKVTQIATNFFNDVEGQSAEVIFNSLLFMSTTFFVKMNTLQEGAGTELYRLFARAVNSDVKRYVEAKSYEVQESGRDSERERGEEEKAGQAATGENAASGVGPESRKEVE